MKSAMEPGSATEPSLHERVGETPTFSASAVREVHARELGVRFIAGAGTSVVAGVLTLLIGPRAAGAMLAFPAILAASLTLIAEEEDRDEAREDARGSVLGGLALAAFAAVAATTLLALPGALAIALAAVAWAAVAIGGYFALWR